MPVRSFDIFDTVLTRDVARPSDLFLLLGDAARRNGWVRLSPGEFRQTRAQAELEARRQVPEGEVVLDEIYAVLARQLNWTESVRNAARDTELRLESESLRAIPSAVAEVSRARASGAKILFLSDMYLPSAFLRDVLHREGAYESGDEIFVSGENRASKASGKLYQLVRQKLGDNARDWLHLGDNPQADGKMAAKNGVRFELTREAALTRHELAVESRPDAEPLWRSLLAGAMRRARLSRPPDESKSVVWDTACDVAGPLLFGFVHWCLAEAERTGIRRLYFVSRDGQVLRDLALIIIEKWNFKVEARYLYGSRQAWHPASIGSLTEADFEWIMVSNWFLSLRHLLARVGLAPEDFKSEAAATGLPATEPDRNLTPEERARRKDFLLNPVVKLAVERESARRRNLVTGYLRQEGFFDGTPSALVDIGWHGSMQKSLSKVLELDGRKTVLTGLYFGLIRKRKHNPDDRLEAYWNKLQSSGRWVTEKERTMMEIFVSADHGSVFGYRDDGGKISAVLNRPNNTQALNWGAHTLQAGVRAFGRAFCSLTRKEDCRSEALFEIARAGFNRLVSDPSRPEAEVFGRFEFSDDQTESSFSPLVPNWSTWTAFRAVFQRRLRPPFWWHEGYLAIHPSILLRWYTQLRNFNERRHDAAHMSKAG